MPKRYGGLARAKRPGRRGNGIPERKLAANLLFLYRIAAESQDNLIFTESGTIARRFDRITGLAGGSRIDGNEETA